MKRFGFFIALALAVLFQCNAQNCIITGKTAGLPDDVSVNLYKFAGNYGTLIGSCSTKDGAFRMEVPLDSGLTKAKIIIFNDGFPKSGRNLMLRPGAKVDIDGSSPYILLWQVKSDVPQQAEMDLFDKKCEDLIAQKEKINHDYAAALYAAPDKKTKDSIYEAFNAKKSLLDSIGHKIDKRCVELLENMPVSEVWIEKLTEISSYYGLNDKTKSLAPRLMALYNNLDENQKNSPSGKKIYLILNTPSKINVGDSLPSCVFYDTNGGTHSLDEFKGKWILIDFWNAGCQPCILAIPELHDLADRYSEDLAVVSLSTNEESVWKEASKRLKITGNNWNENKENLGLFKAFGYAMSPLYVLVSPEGIVRQITPGYSKGKLERIYKQRQVVNNGN